MSTRTGSGPGRSSPAAASSLAIMTAARARTAGRPFRRLLAAVTTVAVIAAIGMSGVRAASADVVSGTVYTFGSVSAGRMLEVPSGQTANGTPVQIWDSSSGSNQQWRAGLNGDGSYTLTNLASGRVLDEPGGQTADGTKIQIWDSNGGANQHWRLTQNGDGSYAVTNVASGRVLDLPGWQSVNGTAVEIWDSNGGANQHWNLAPAGSTGGGGSLPSSLHWSDQGPLMSAKPAAGHNIVSVKDPSIVRYNGQWLVYATTADTAGSWSVEYTHFSDFSQAASAPQYYLSDNPNIGGRYMAAPQLFYFAPKNKWFLVFQQGPPAFSTTSDPTQPQTWSTPTNFFASDPPAVVQRGKGWLDFFVICDSANCYLFGADDAGDIFRSQTTLADFPNGFGNTTIVLHDDNAGNVFEGTAVYKVKGSNTYLMLVEGFDSAGKRIYRAWTSTGLAGSWTPYADPFAGSANTSFPAGQWTNDVSHGELIRTGYDQNLEIDPCHLQFFYQGVDPGSTGVSYSQIPWKLGLLTQTNAC